MKALKIAQIIHHNKIPNVVPGGIKSIGRNRVVVEFKTGDDANKFITNETLKANDLTAMIPRFHITRTCVVRNVPVEWTMEELVESLSTPSECGPVIKAPASQ